MAVEATARRGLREEVVQGAIFPVLFILFAYPWSSLSFPLLTTPCGRPACQDHSQCSATTFGRFSAQSRVFAGLCANRAWWRSSECCQDSAHLLTARRLSPRLQPRRAHQVLFLVSPQQIRDRWRDPSPPSNSRRRADKKILEKNIAFTVPEPFF
eukprot:g70044.t1